jgi:hypothetical protein
MPSTRPSRLKLKLDGLVGSFGLFDRGVFLFALTPHTDT